MRSSAALSKRGSIEVADLGEHKFPRNAGQADVHHVGSALAAMELEGQGAAGGAAGAESSLPPPCPMIDASTGALQQGAEPAMATEDEDDQGWGQPGAEPYSASLDYQHEREPGSDIGGESEAGEMPGILDEDCLFPQTPHGRPACPNAPPPSPAPFALFRDSQQEGAAGSFMHQQHTLNRGARMAAEAARATAQEIAREIEARLALGPLGNRVLHAAAAGMPDRTATPGMEVHRLAVLNPAARHGAHAGSEPAGGMGNGDDGEVGGGGGWDEGDKLAAEIGDSMMLEGT